MKFVEFSKQTGRQLTEEAALDLDDLLDDIESNAVARRQEKQRLMAALDRKEGEELAQLSTEDLRKRIADLD